MQAVRLLDVQEFERAIPAYGLVLRRMPDFHLALHGRGIAYYHEERLDRALKDFDRAIELKPDFADAYVSRALLLRDQGDTQKAIADVERALSLYDPVRDARQMAEATLILLELR